MDAKKHLGTIVIGNFFDIERLVHSLKTGIACIIGLLLSKLIGFPADQWVVITIIVVMCAQIYVGSVLQKAYLRFIGTCIGCLFGIIAITLVDHSLLAVALSIGISSLVFSYVATSGDKYSYAGTLGAVTIVIIVLGQNQEPTITFAIERFIEITLGIFIATIVSQFVLPIHARTHLRRTQASTLRQLRDLYVQAMMTPKSDAVVLNYLDLDENIIKSLTKQRQLAQESTHEPKGSEFDPENFMHSFYCEKEMLRAIDFMYNALSHLSDDKRAYFNSDAMKKFNDEILRALDTLVKVIEDGKPNSEHIHIPKLDVIKQMDPSFYIDGLLFSAEILTENLAKLAGYYHIQIYSGE